MKLENKLRNFFLAGIIALNLATACERKHFNNIVEVRNRADYLKKELEIQGYPDVRMSRGDFDGNGLKDIAIIGSEKKVRDSDGILYKETTAYTFFKQKPEGDYLLKKKYLRTKVSH